MADARVFGKIMRTRQFTYCPTCRPEPYTEQELAGLAGVLRVRIKRWFTCACGMRWRMTASGVSVEVALVAAAAA